MTKVLYTYPITHFTSTSVAFLTSHVSGRVYRLSSHQHLCALHLLSASRLRRDEFDPRLQSSATKHLATSISNQEDWSTHPLDTCRPNIALLPPRWGDLQDDPQGEAVAQAVREAVVAPLAAHDGCPIQLSRQPTSVMPDTSLKQPS